MPLKAMPHMRMYQYDAVLFDLDGTLLNTLEDLTNAVNHTLRSFGYPPRTLGEVRAFVGNGIRKLIERALPGGAADPYMEAALTEFKRYYTGHCNVRTRPYEGVTDAMSALAEAGIKLAVVSNKNDEAVRALSRAYFGSLVTVAVGGREGVSRKPAPDMPMLALEALGATPERSLFVGDSDVDRQTALNTGMDCMLVTWGFRDREMLAALAPRFLVDDAAEMPALILQGLDEEP
ncbi:MAG TPA: HAD-IA family hydrolase [Candidatus Limiplasma sp.]|nr:HAD-IA family hydrolase [Candidatus Limiplasma sp.]HPS81576.1 HAD-IA family hydrolase [Candidatus Limiplasma sp.]